MEILIDGIRKQIKPSGAGFYVVNDEGLKLSFHRVPEKWLSGGPGSQYAIRTNGHKYQHVKSER